MPRLVQVITAQTRVDVQDRVKAGATEEDISAWLGLSVERVKRVFRRELELAPANAKHEVLSKLFESATSGNNTAAGIFWAKSRYGWRDTGALAAGPIDWPPLIVEIGNDKRHC